MELKPKSKVLNISPTLDRGDGKNMCEDVRLGLKTQTIRSYAIPKGTKLYIWAKKRGMKKGWYCTECWKNLNECMCNRDGEIIPLPQKLIDAVALEPIHIDVKIWNYKGYPNNQELQNLWVSIRGSNLSEKYGCDKGVELTNWLLKLFGKPNGDCHWDDDEMVWSIMDSLYSEKLSPFAKADGFTSNKAAIDFFSKYLEDGWNQLYINRWEPTEQKEGD